LADDIWSTGDEFVVWRTTRVWWFKWSSWGLCITFRSSTLITPALGSCLFLNVQCFVIIFSKSFFPPFRLVHFECPILFMYALKYLYFTPYFQIPQCISPIC
jgi:hypothetical protein